MSTRVKICGIRNVAQALSAVESGADAIGLVFYPSSPRAVSTERAAEIVQVLPAFVTAVGLFVNASTDEVNKTLNSVSLGLLQFHGDETPEFCSSFKRPWIKALRIRSEKDLTNIETWLNAGSQGILLDAWHEGLYGGSGETFDWNLLSKHYGEAKNALSSRIILAGGLNPDNVKEAITVARPWAVDVSSGVESSLGEKSVNLLAKFMQEVRSV